MHALTSKLIVGLLLAAAFSVTHAAPPPAPRYKVSRETTYFTAPLKSDGRVDFPTALSEELSKNLKPDANAAVLYWQAVGPAPIDESLRTQFFKLLASPQLDADGNYFVPAAEYFKGHRIDVGGDDELVRLLQKVRTRIWSAESEPNVAAWLEANRQPLDRIVAASKLARFVDPIVLTPGELLGRSNLVADSRRTLVAEALVARALNSRSRGKVDDAWRDILACHRLAQLISTGPSLVDWHQADEIQAIAFRGMGALFDGAFPSAERAKHFAREFAGIPRFQEVSPQLDLHARIEMLQAVSIYEQAGLSKLREMDIDVEGFSVLELPSDAMLDSLGKRLDWNRVLLRVNRLADRVTAANAKPTQDEVTAAHEAIQEELGEAMERAADLSTLYQAVLLNSSDGITRWVGDAVLTSFCQLVMWYDRTTPSDMRSELITLAFALEHYRADHKRYPAELSDLAPFYTPKVPTDEFGGDPFRYARQNAGYVLYSIGPNYTDDNGQSQVDDESGDSDDLVIRVNGEKTLK